MNELHSVLSAKVKQGFILEIAFEDGKIFALDFKPWIEISAKSSQVCPQHS